MGLIFYNVYTAVIFFIALFALYVFVTILSIKYKWEGCEHDGDDGTSYVPPSRSQKTKLKYALLIVGLISTLSSIYFVHIGMYRAVYISISISLIFIPSFIMYKVDKH